VASLDVSDVTICPEFSDTFQLMRRQEMISSHGRTTVSVQQTQNILGTLYPTGDNSLVRQEDFQHGQETLTIATPFRLRIGSPGYQPDYIAFRGDLYMVRSVQDYTQYGAGFVVAECSSIRSVDTAPQ
jgi:hypothetical protein